MWERPFYTYSPSRGGQIVFCEFIHTWTVLCEDLPPGLNDISIRLRSEGSSAQRPFGPKLGPPPQKMSNYIGLLLEIVRICMLCGFLVDVCGASTLRQIHGQAGWADRSAGREASKDPGCWAGCLSEILR